MEGDAHEEAWQHQCQQSSCCCPSATRPSCAAEGVGEGWKVTLHASLSGMYRCAAGEPLTQPNGAYRWNVGDQTGTKYEVVQRTVRCEGR